MKRYSLFLILFLCLCSCQPSLYKQPRLNTYALHGNRLPIADTYVHRLLKDQAPLSLKVDSTSIKRGKQYFEIYCMVCHGIHGDGNGVVTQRGFSHPPSYHTDYLRKAKSEHYYDVITNGRGLMTRLGDRIDPNDRWYIIAYVRSLQQSQLENKK